MWGSAERENVGPFLPSSVSASEELFGVQSDRVRGPFFYWVVVGKVWEINGLWEGSARRAEVGRNSRRWKSGFQVRKEKYNISRAYGFPSICPRRRRRELLGLRMGAVLLRRRW